MMIRIVLSLLLCSQFVFAQQDGRSGKFDPPAPTTFNFANVYEAGEYVRVIIDKVNWRQNFTLKEEQGIDNAYATVEDGRRYILYDNKFLTALDRYANTRWASISVLAHEIGHHYYSHLINGQSSTPVKELEADYFSGYALAKIGATMGEATAAIQKIAPVQGDASHPGRAERINAIQRGWNYANAINTSTAKTARPPVPQPQENPLPAANKTGWINLALYGDNAMTVYLSDDGRNYSPVNLKTNQTFVFKYEIYNYGFLRLANSPNPVTYKLTHNKDYSIIWNRKANNWTVVEVK